MNKFFWVRERNLAQSIKANNFISKFKEDSFNSDFVILYKIF